MIWIANILVSALVLYILYYHVNISVEIKIVIAYIIGFAAASILWILG